MKKIIFAALALMPAAACSSASAAPADATRLDALLVTASPVDAPSSRAMRSVQVLERRDIERSGATNLADLLARQPGLSIQRRGAPGVQADLGIRGSNFEQTLILLDGVPIQNAQTGHHNLDLPVPLSHIERIEIVRGPGAIQYGGSATGGVINLITREATGTEGSVEAGFGSNSTRQLGARIAGAGKLGAHGLSFGALDSDGDDRSGPSDARVRQALYTGARAGEAGRVFWGAGALEKDFGAWGFYSAEYPDARERTEGRLAWLGGEARAGAWRLHARAHFDRHEDWFLTRIGTRDYINEHLTRARGILADAQREDASGTTAMGVQLRKDHLRSNALKNHERDFSSFWLLRQQQLGANSRAEFSLSRAHHSGQGSYWLPGLAFSHDFSDAWRGYAAAARSARAPSYTELYLTTAANRGSASLRPELSDHAELGIEGRAGEHRLNLALHERLTRDLIDWVRAPGTATWLARNVDEHRARGLEAGWRWTPAAIHWLESAGLGYEHLRVRVDGLGNEVKYATRVPTRTWSADARMNLGAGFALDVDLRRPRLPGQPTATLANARLGWQGETLRAHIAVQNLLDREVIETGFAPIPGRWLTLGVAADWR